MSRILVVGSLNMDMTARVEKLPELGATIMANDFYKSCGGKGANQAIAMSKLGLDVSMIGMVGRDDDGEELIKNLINNGIDNKVIYSNTTTGKAIITVDTKGDNNIIVIPGANFALTKDSIKESLIAELKVSDGVLLQNEIPMDTIEYVLEKARDMGKITYFNPAPATKLDDKILSLVDYLVVNETELKVVLGVDSEISGYELEVEKIKKEKGIKNILLTLGSRGSCLFNEKNEIEKCGAYKVKAIDTTAAGDSFLGAFISKSLNGESIEKALKYASATSAIVVTRIGAQDSIPSPEEINLFLKERENV